MELRFFKDTCHQDVFEKMSGIRRGQPLMETLVAMQQDKGVSPETARDDAAATMLMVSSVESIHWDVSDNKTAALAKLIEDIKGIQPYDDRLIRYHKLYFNLTVHYDKDAMSKLIKGVSMETLFWQYYSNNRFEGTEEELIDAIYDAVEHYDMPEAVFTSMAEKFSDSKNYFATAEAMGDFEYELKCIATMNLYLENKDTMTLQEAANEACCGVELQMAADSVYKGLDTSETAKKILIVAGITLAIVGAAAAIYFTGSQVALTAAANSVLPVELPSVFADFAATTAASELPPVFAEFAEFATGTASGSGAAATLVDLAWKYKPMIEVAKNKALTGMATMLGGIGLVSFSPSLSELIGKLRVGIADNQESAIQDVNYVAQNGESIANGLQTIANHASTSEDVIHSNNKELRKAQEHLTQAATAKA